MKINVSQKISFYDDVFPELTMMAKIEFLYHRLHIWFEVEYLHIWVEVAFLHIWVEVAYFHIWVEVAYLHILVEVAYLHIWVEQEEALAMKSIRKSPAGEMCGALLGGTGYCKSKW